MPVKLPSMPHAVTLHLPPTLEACAVAAFQCRTPEQALEQPTLHMMAGAYDTQNVTIAVTQAVHAAMAYFAPAKRLTPQQIDLFAEEVMNDYRHETLADVHVFMRKAAVGSFDNGDTYGALDVPRLGAWWRQYLDNKAEARERILAKERSEAVKATSEALAAVPNFGAEVDRRMSSPEQRAADAVQRMRLARLPGKLAHMTDDDMRAEWKHHGKEGRDILLREAARRGLTKANA